MKLFSQIIIGLVGLIIGIKLLIGFFKVIIYLIKNTKTFSLTILFQNYTNYVDGLIDDLSILKALFIYMGFVVLPVLSLVTSIGMWIEWAFR